MNSSWFRWRAVLAVFLGSLLCQPEIVFPPFSSSPLPPLSPPTSTFSARVALPRFSAPAILMASASRRVNKAQFKRMGNFLRSIGGVEELRYLMPLLQKYIVQRTMDSAMADNSEVQNSEEEEEAIFFSLMDEYGTEDHRGNSWSAADKAEVKKRSVKLVKMMKRRLEAKGEDTSL